MGSYRLVRRVACGGMAEVFLGKTVGAEGFQKPVAVKRVLPHISQEPRFLELFLREARLTCALQHANVVQVFDLGLSAGQPYMVLEFVDGENLRTLLSAARRSGQGLPLREALFIVQQVAEGLAYAHERCDSRGAPLQVIHRDINPANVLVSMSGEVKLSDFGIARAGDFNAETQVGVVKGKPGYLSPEQVLGKTADQRSDLFLMGLLLFECLVGRPLFDSANFFQSLHDLRTFEPSRLPALPGVPEGVMELLARALMPQPEERFQSARALADALQGFLFEQRLRVGPSDVAALMRQLFPERLSALAGLQDVKGEEVQLDAIAPDVPEEESSWTAEPLPPEPSVAAAAPPAPVCALPLLSPTRPAPMLAYAPLALPVIGQPRTAPGSSAEHTAARQGAAAPIPGAPPRASRFTAPGTTQHMSHSQQVSTGAILTPHAGAEEMGAVARLPSAVPTSAPGPSARGRGSRRPLGELLLSRGKVSPVRLKAVLERQKRGGGRLGELLVAEGLLTEDDLVRSLGEQLSHPFVTSERLRTMPPPGPDVLGLVPREKAERLFAVPLAVHRRELYCAMREPLNLARLAELEFVAGMAVKGVLAGEGALRLAIRRFFPGARTSFRTTLPGAAVVTGGAATSAPLQPERPAAAPPERPLPPAVRLYTRLMDGALEALGGAASEGGALGRLAGRVARRLGASEAEAEEAVAAGAALALAARMAGAQAFLFPTRAALRALLGPEAAGLEDVLVACSSDGSGTPGSRRALAVACAAHLLRTAGTASPAPGLAARTLAALRQRATLEPEGLDALEAALAEEVAAQAAGMAGTGPRVLLAMGEAEARELEAQLIVEGLQVVWVEGPATLQQHLAHGADALVMSTTLPGLDALTLTRQLRECGPLPIFLVTPGEDAGVTTAGLAAGADDVVSGALPVEVLATELRRTLAQRSAARAGTAAA